MSRILRLEPASQPQNLRAEPEKLERVTYRFRVTKETNVTVRAITTEYYRKNNFLSGSNGRLS